MSGRETAPLPSPNSERENTSSQGLPPSWTGSCLKWRRSYSASLASQHVDVAGGSMYR